MDSATYAQDHRAPAVNRADLDEAVRKAFRHLLPLLFACYVMAYIDRINFGFAAITMNSDLGITLTQFGLAGTLFYAAYFFFEVPSNLLLVRFGARRWIARIMISWGLASMATCLATGPWGLYIARVILGIAEAGFLPGVLLYLTFWIPASKRGRANALFMTAQPAAIMLGSPLSGMILASMDGYLGMHGWQWMFIIEALPTIALGLVVLKYLPDGPKKARWLTQAQRDALVTELASEQVTGQSDKSKVSFKSFVNFPFVTVCVANLFMVASLSTLGTWSPLIIKDIYSGSSVLNVGFAAAFPGLAAIIMMPLLCASSDRRQERAGHFAFAAALSALGWLASTQTGDPELQLIGLIAATAGGFSAMALLWTIPPTMLSRLARPLGIGVMTTCGILGSVISPTINGILRQATGSYVATGWLGVFWMGAAAVLIVIAVMRQKQMTHSQAD
ncbi:MFS transporter [Pseudomonas alliivorans]|nr:MFS transporter [Pseudomonas alliivorans]MEE4622476.1 MFS transporter [Pseudomonas alliivorans]MEE4788149.1 MFS transporter [Pseudomonas alliivorans]MEE4791493.1 MFS transporter [Pseudomonas alliivorans]MEE4797644.1 MFS transporter [Pseudomonas alliivorans]